MNQYSTFFKFLGARIVNTLEAMNSIIIQPDESGYRNILDSALDSVFVIHGETYVYVNKQGARLLGFDFPEELIGKSMFDFTARAQLM